MLDTNPYKTIATMGMIGSGKTTLSEELAKRLGPKTLYLTEPDDRAEHFNPYLARYYENGPRWSFTIQAHLLGKRYALQQAAQWYVTAGLGDAVIDSCYWQDVAFAHVQLKLGMMAQDEFDSYKALYTGMTLSVAPPMFCLRIMTTPEVSQQRIKYRAEKREGRKCESGISLEYLTEHNAEVGRICQTLQRMGTIVIQVPWDGRRKFVSQRKDTVEQLARQIRETRVENPLFDKIHLRLV